MRPSARMFLRPHHRDKDGKRHTYWSLVETVRTPDGPRQRTLCHLGELNDSAQARWLKTIEVFNEMLAWLKPGRTIDELCDHYVELCGAKGAEDRSGVMYHSNGLGNDYPRLGPRMKDQCRPAMVSAAPKVQTIAAPVGRSSK